MGLVIIVMYDILCLSLTALVYTMPVGGVILGAIYTLHQALMAVSIYLLRWLHLPTITIPLERL